MSKHLSPFYKHVLVGLFALFFFQQTITIYVTKTYATCYFKNSSIPRSECPNTDVAPTIYSTNTYWTTFDIDYAYQNPDSVNTGAAYYYCNHDDIVIPIGEVTCPAGAIENYCCQTNACGLCTETCTRPRTQCWEPSMFPSPSIYPTVCYCFECKVCAPCLTQAAQPTNAPQQGAAADGGCECLEMKPIEDKANHKLSFECLVVGSKDTQITGYTATLEKPGGTLITLNKDAVTPVSCSSSVAPDSTCYTVKTTTINNTVPGTYKMIVPPQITCQ